MGGAYWLPSTRKRCHSLANFFKKSPTFFRDHLFERITFSESHLLFINLTPTPKVPLSINLKKRSSLFSILTSLHPPKVPLSIKSKKKIPYLFSWSSSAGVNHFVRIPSLVFLFQPLPPKRALLSLNLKNTVPLNPNFFFFYSNSPPPQKKRGAVFVHAVIYQISLKILYLFSWSSVWVSHFLQIPSLFFFNSNPHPPKRVPFSISLKIPYLFSWSSAWENNFLRILFLFFILTPHPRGSLIYLFFSKISYLFS